MSPDSTEISVRFKRRDRPGANAGSFQMKPQSAQLTRRQLIAGGVAALALPGCARRGADRPRIGLAFETLQTEYWEASWAKSASG